MGVVRRLDSCLLNKVLALQIERSEITPLNEESYLEVPRASIRPHKQNGVNRSSPSTDESDLGPDTRYADPLRARVSIREPVIFLNNAFKNCLARSAYSNWRIPLIPRPTP